MNVREIDDSVVEGFLTTLEMRHLGISVDTFHYWAVMTSDNKFIGLCLPAFDVYIVDFKGYLNTVKGHADVLDYFKRLTGETVSLVDLPPY